MADCSDVFHVAPSSDGDGKMIPLLVLECRTSEMRVTGMPRRLLRTMACWNASSDSVWVDNRPSGTGGWAGSLPAPVMGRPWVRWRA